MASIQNRTFLTSHGERVTFAISAERGSAAQAYDRMLEAGCVGVIVPDAPVVAFPLETMLNLSVSMLASRVRRGRAGWRLIYDPSCSRGM